MKKNIVIFLKIAIIMAIGLLIFYIVRNSDFSLAASSLSGLTRREFVEAIDDDPSLILDGKSKNYVGTTVYCGADSDSDDYLSGFINSACFAHYYADYGSSSYKVKQAVSIRYDSDNDTYYAYNYTSRFFSNNRFRIRENEF